MEHSIYVRFWSTFKKVINKLYHPVAFQTKFLQIMYSYKSHVNNINFITKKRFQVALRKKVFYSALMKQQGTLLLRMLKGTHMRPYK